MPYADHSNPQSLNLHDYTLDNPEANVDLDGHCPLCAVIQRLIAGGMDPSDALYAANHLASLPAPQQQNNNTPAKIVIVASDTVSHGSYSTFTCKLENSSNRPLTGRGCGVEEHLFSDRAAHHHTEIGHNSDGKFVPATDGRVNDTVGYLAPGNRQKGYNVYQTFTVRYAGRNYNLNTEFEHETVVDKNRYINNVVVVQP